MSTFVLALQAFLFIIAVPARAADYRPEALGEVGARVEQAARAGARPVVVFDLDDTLINSRERTTRILRELGESEEVRRAFPDDAETLAATPVSRVRYYLEETFANLGIDNKPLLAQANEFWLKRFFTNDYCAKDKPVRGAVGYVSWLAKLGAKVVYLTGRDAPNMEPGTRYNLTRSRFPMSPENTLLLMKPDPKMDDTEFKKTALAAIGRLGDVVGVFENEPRNINVLHAAFPAAVAVFVDTVHSNKPDVPAADVAWVRDFRSE
ncbi:MAG: HAD family hydrolase [Deltaproteobacteria bacterium]|nr:HAD family hydrolase [Deltaproteobacteria bacterium]